MAELMGEFHKLKYYKDDLAREINCSVDAAFQNSWKSLIYLKAKGLEIRECDGFFDTMIMGEKPQRTCMSYINGAYNSCLLSNFDSNKHIIYAYKNNQIVGRALLRVSKGCFGNVNSEKESLTFVDLTNEQEREENVNEKLDEKLTLFLERSYFANVGPEEIDQISKLFIELAERKALELSSRLIISTSYRGVAKEYIEARYYFYISRSKGGEQYFDSLSGRASVSDEQSYRRNRFLISKESLKE